MNRMAAIPQVPSSMRPKLTQLEARLTDWLVRNSVPMLRVSLGAVLLGFGVLKFFPGVSPAEALTKETVETMTLGLAPGGVALVLVALMETALGLALIVGRISRPVLALLGMQMIGILSPLVLVPDELFRSSAAPTIEGQYVIKDIVLLAATLVIAARALAHERSRQAEPATARTRRDEIDHRSDS